jgi:hypothetical protein
VTAENEPWGARPWVLRMEPKRTAWPRFKRGQKPASTLVLCECGGLLGWVGDRWGNEARCFFLNEDEHALYRLDGEGVFRRDTNPPASLVYGRGRFKVDRDRRRWPEARESQVETYGAGPLRIAVQAADIPGKTGDSPVYRTFFLKGAGGVQVKDWSTGEMRLGAVLMPEAIHIACPRSSSCGRITLVALDNLWRRDSRMVASGQAVGLY